MATQDSTPERTYCVYRIVCFPTGKVYVGKAINPRVRRNKHFWDLAVGCHHNVHLQNAYNKYGRQAFYFEIIERGVLPESVNEREQHWINYFNSYKSGFNRTQGGDGGGGHNIRVIWNGAEYESISDAARASGVTPQSMRARLSKGYTCDDDIPKPKTCTWNGITYNSFMEAAQALGIREGVLRYRIKRGFTCDEQVPLRERACEWNGISYKSITKAASANGVEYKLMERWLRSGYTCDSDVRAPGEHSRKACTWNGVQYPSFTAASSALGVSYDALVRWIKDGYTCDADVPNRRKRKSSNRP